MGMITRFFRSQPSSGRDRPPMWETFLQSTASYLTSARFSALPSAMSDVASTSPTNSVEKPVMA
jgi:hypothetical protein